MQHEPISIEDNGTITALDVLVTFLDDKDELIPFLGEPLPPITEALGAEWEQYCVEF